MAVERDFEREAIVLKWDPAKVGSPEDKVDLRTESSDDVSGRTGLDNDGAATVTVPKGAHGEFLATVTGPAGTDESDGPISY